MSMNIKVMLKITSTLVATILSCFAGNIIPSNITRSILLHDHKNRTKPHKGCSHLLDDRIPILTKPPIEDSDEYRLNNQIAPTAAKCINGKASGYNCKDVDLLSVVDLGTLNFNGGAQYGNDVWGWAKNGREFAFMGIESGTIFIEITNPYEPVIVGKLPSHTSLSDWRDIKTIDSYAFIVSEAAKHGMQIFNLDKLLQASPKTLFQETAHFNGFGNAHNIFINEDTSFAYAVGSNKCKGGLYIINLKNPLRPKAAACFSSDRYTHDVQCVVYNGPHKIYKGKEICFSANEDTITIVDVTEKNNILQLARTSYNYAYTHQGWLTDDHSYFIFNDELDEYYYGFRTRTHVLDIRNLLQPNYVGYHTGRTNSIDHNLYVKGNLIHQANYRAGYNVLEIIDASTATFLERGYFDIFPSSDSNNFNGAWSNYPYFPSGNVVVSGIEQGLFVLHYSGVKPNSCHFTNSKTCYEKGCHWKNKRCRQCFSKKSREGCRKAGCYWSMDKCSSCNDLNEATCKFRGCAFSKGECKSCHGLNEKLCIAASCAFRNGNCFSCKRFTTKKTCNSMECRWKKDGKRCEARS